MKNPSIYALALAGLLLAGSAASAQRPAQRPDAPGPKPMVREKIVIVDKDGKEHVYDSEGTPVRRGYLGVGLTELSPELRAHFGAPEDAGVMVSSVEDGSPADKAGLKVGDIIAALDGKDVKSSWDIRSQVRELKEGEQVPITVYRDGKAQNLSAAIAMRERAELDMAPFLFRGGDGENQPMVLQLDRERLRNLPRGQGTPGEGDVLLRRGMRSPREAELEKRLKELEKRLADLEKLLEKK
ncbi:MAG TPA: PDZ domain-containing protein [Thermoanaerobaculia bacterium]|jgi:membrane-associated protease RseP (regulator of RpoE activity)|nr:PDZ domain-containing protein [Thermoanaerobaculia bacterium]